MFEAGFSHLNLALVSSDKTVRETTKRPHTLEAYLKIVHRAHALGFQIVSYQILGLPNESLDSMIQTLAFNTRLPVLLGASPFYRTPASPIARGLDFTEEDYVKARLTAMAVETDEFRREDIYSLFITTRVINFLKGLRLSASTDANALWIVRGPKIGRASALNCSNSSEKLIAFIFGRQKVCLRIRSSRPKFFSAYFGRPEKLAVKTVNGSSSGSSQVRQRRGG
jgi:tRNA A37 methylthiotransferase MiaB